MPSAGPWSTAAPYAAAIFVGAVVVLRPQWLRHRLWMRGVGAAASVLFLFYAVTRPEQRYVSLLWLFFAGMALFRSFEPEPPRSTPPL